MKIETLDLMFQNNEKAIASFVIDSKDGLILVESGPQSTFESLTQGLKSLGAETSDVKHVFLTHIHFDHAGAAWCFAEKGAKIYVNPHGLKHLNNPEKLWNSAERIYGDQMSRLWGSMTAIQTSQLVALDDLDVVSIGEVEVRTHYTPGHAIHHNAYQIGDYIFNRRCGRSQNRRWTGYATLPTT